MESEPLIEAIDGASRLIVLSPHLDDAVLSCGALMNHARTETSVTVVTFFTEGSEPPYTYGARRYLHKTRDRHANSFFLARRAEDQAVLEGAGISYVHVGLKEILFRHRTQPLLNQFPWASRLIPELSYAILLCTCMSFVAAYRRMISARYAAYLIRLIVSRWNHPRFSSRRWALAVTKITYLCELPPS